MSLQYDVYTRSRDDPAISLVNATRDLKANLPISSLFILFVLIGGNYISPLFPCGLQDFLDKNMPAKHALGFFTLLLFVELTNSAGDEDNLGWRTIIMRSVFLYIWFVFTTTMEPVVFFVLVGMMACLYVMRLYIDKMDKEADPAVIKRVTQLRKIENGLYYSCLAVTVFGVIAYYGRKKAELGKGFSLERFFVGNPSCKGTHPPGNVWSNFLMAFPKN